MHRIPPLTASLITALAFVSTSAFAGRPLSVDDANIDDKGTGHIEAWVAREPGKADVVNVAPAYSPWHVVELSGLLSRNRTNSISSVGVLARVQITEPKKSGCNFLVALGHQHFSPGGNQPFAYTTATCNRGDFTLHGNLGAANPSRGPSFGTWGIALEHDTGTFTAHIESFGQEDSKPTFQVGARREVAKGWQVDGTMGRIDGETIFSLGFKVSF
jgi:hypothetical protein